MAIENLSSEKKLPVKKIVVASVIGILVIVFLCCIGSLVEDVKNEDIVVNQVPITGTMYVWSQPGMYAQKLGHTTKYHKTEQLWFGAICFVSRPITTAWTA